MRFNPIASAFLFGVSLLSLFSPCVTRLSKTNGVEASAAITWDQHSLFINKERVFIQSGEFHPWRLPSDGLWLDILQKFAAAGLNTVSIYVHWGLVNPIRGMTDWSGFRKLQPIFDGARQTGLWVIVRPGPYINAETTAGGIPGWVTTLNCSLRTNASAFDEAWRQYWIELAELVEPNQVGRPNGTVIAVQVENEYLTDAHSFEGQPPGKDGYMRDLEQSLKDNGIYVPLTFNDAGMDNNFVRGMGSVDIYGFDSYPQSFDCSRPSYWKPVVEKYGQYQSSLQLDSPLYIPEFQAGAFDPWGPHGANYDLCRELTGPSFESVFNLNNLAANAKMVNFYMVFGGTSWGYLPFPGTYTSYDYGAAISEDRFLNEKYPELKRQSFFLRTSKDFYKTDIVGDSRTRKYCTGSNESGFVTELRNPDNGAGFYILRAANSTSLQNTTCTLNVLTSGGPVQLPSITLRPRRSRLLVTDYNTPSITSSGNGNSAIQLLYTTSNVLLSANIGGRAVLYLFSDDEHDEGGHPIHESPTSVLRLPGLESGLSTTTWNDRDANVLIEKSNEKDGYLRINWPIPQPEEVIAIQTLNGTVLLTSEAVAGQAWNPVINSSTSSGFTAASVLIWGPHLVRNASVILDDGQNVLHIWGDVEEGKETSVSIYTGDSDVHGVCWNGRRIKNLVTTKSGFHHFQLTPQSFHQLMNSSWTGLKQAGDRIDFSKLEWTYRDSLPELEEDFEDDDWVDADHTESVSPYKKLFGKYYLYACDYGFCNGATIWRGHFKVLDRTEAPQLTLQKKETYRSGLRLAISGGDSFAASVWINGVFINTTVAKSNSTESRSRITEQIYRFPPGSIRTGGHNVITVIQDSMGMDQTEEGFSETVKHPRGILGYQFEEVGVDNFEEIKWKVQGQLGGFYWLPDPDRGIMNENGFFGIRSGWHLPSYPLRNSSRLIQSPITDGMSKAGIGFYHTKFDLDFPRGYDVMLSFRFGEIEVEGQATAQGGRYRVEFWVNGWHQGRFVSDLGPQNKFPVHEGILDFHGSNDLALTLWAMDGQGAKIKKLDLSLERVLEGGMGPVKTSNPVFDSSLRRL